MKNKILYILLSLPFLQGCVANEQTGEMEPGWVFWVLLGLLLGGLFIGAIVNYLKKRKSDDSPTKTQQEIEAYEETLKNKLNKNSDEKEEKQ